MVVLLLAFLILFVAPACLLGLGKGIDRYVFRGRRQFGSPPAAATSAEAEPKA